MENDTQIIELTSKKLKKQLLVSIALMVIGILILSSAMDTQDNSGGMIGSLLTMGGLIGIVITKIRIWWNHK